MQSMPDILVLQSLQQTYLSRHQVTLLHSANSGVAWGRENNLGSKKNGFNRDVETVCVMKGDVSIGKLLKGDC